MRRSRVRGKMQNMGREMEEKRKERSLGRSRSDKKEQDQEEADEGETRSWSVRKGAVRSWSWETGHILGLERVRLGHSDTRTLPYTSVSGADTCSTSTSTSTSTSESGEVTAIICGGSLVTHGCPASQAASLFHSGHCTVNCGQSTPQCIQCTVYSVQYTVCQSVP